MVAGESIQPETHLMDIRKDFIDSIGVNTHMSWSNTPMLEVGRTCEEPSVADHAAPGDDTGDFDSIDDTR